MAMNIIMGSIKYNCLLLNALIITFNFAYGQLCDDANTEQDCIDIRESGQNCYFNETSDECVTFNCGSLTNQDTCETFDDEYKCKWANIDSIDNFCYAQCGKNIDIVFMVDTTASIIDPIPDRTIIYGDFIQYLMTSWYSLNNQYQNVATYFSLITFGDIVTTQFDLNTKYETCLYFLCNN